MHPMSSGYAPPSQIDATKIVSKLYQGSVPVSAAHVRRNGFQVLVFCAVEIQPPDTALTGHGVHVIRCPIDDNGQPLSPHDTQLVRKTAAQVAMYVTRGSRCLVSCAMGRNRSGLVVALAPHQLMGGQRSGREIVEYIQSRRANALTNPAFVKMIEALP